MLLYRKIFKKVKPPEQRGEFLQLLIDLIVRKYLECNPQCGLNKGDHSFLLKKKKILNLSFS